MTKGKGATVIVAILIIASTVVLYYNHWNDKVVSQDEVLSAEQDELEYLLGINLDKDYPRKPKEVVDMFSRIIQSMYSQIGDEDTDVLAIKVRTLYDEELLAANTEERYLNNLYTEIAQARESDISISRYLFVNEDKETYENIDGQEYANIYVSYTMKQKSRFIETKRFLLRKDEDNRWKILGWFPYSEEK